MSLFETPPAGPLDARVAALEAQLAALTQQQADNAAAAAGATDAVSQQRATGDVSLAEQLAIEQQVRAQKDQETRDLFAVATGQAAAAIIADDEERPDRVWSSQRVVAEFQPKSAKLDSLSGASTAVIAFIEAADAGAMKGALALAKGDVGLGNVDNTSDAQKPISTATQAALDQLAAMIQLFGDLEAGDVEDLGIVAANIANVIATGSSAAAINAIGADLALGPTGSYVLRSLQAAIDANATAASFSASLGRVPGDFAPVTVGGQTVLPALVSFALEMMLGTYKQTGRLWFVDSNRVYAAADQLPGALDWEVKRNFIPIVQERGMGTMIGFDRRADAIQFGKATFASREQAYLPRAAGPFVLAQRNGYTLGGQSIGAGDETEGIVSDVAPYPSNLYTFAPGPKPEAELATTVTADPAPTLFVGKAALLENTEKTVTTFSAGGESPTTGAGAGLIDRLIRSGTYDLTTLPEFFGSTSAVGSQRMSYLLSTGGFNRWNGRILNQIASQKSIAVTDGKTFKYLAHPFVHGQQDAELGLSGSQTLAGYKAGLLQYHTELTAYVQGAPISQAETPLFIMTQPCHKSGLKTGNGGDITARAIFEFQDHQTRFIACPDYWANFRELNYTHPLPLDQRLIGEYIGKVMFIAGILGLQWTGLKPRALWTRGNQAFVRYWVPYEPIAFDIEKFGKITNFGYRVTDSIGDKQVLDGWVHTPDTIGLQLDSPVVGATMIRYALDYDRTTGRYLPNAGSGAGNIRDSDPWEVKIDGVSHRLYNWSQAFALPANVLQAEV